MPKTNFSLIKALQIGLLTELSLFGLWASAEASANEPAASSNIERMEVGQILDIQRVQSERRFYEKVSSILCREKGSELMFPDVCGVAKDMLKNMNNGVRPPLQRKLETEAAARITEPVLPPLSSLKPGGLEKGMDGKGSQPIPNSRGAGYPVATPLPTYQLLGVYGDEDDMQAEFKSSSGRLYLMGLNSRVGKFRVIEILPEGIEIQVLSDEKAERIFVAVGSRL